MIHQDELGQTFRNALDDIVRNTIRRYGLETQINRIIDVIYNDKMVIRNHGNFSGKQFEPTDVGD